MQPLDYCITDSHFWRFFAFYLAIYIPFLGCAALGQSLSSYSWYGYKNHTLLGGLLVLANFGWLLLPLGFVIDFIKLVFNLIYL